MTDETMPFAVEPEKDSLPQPGEYFDGNESELPEPDEDFDEATSDDEGDGEAEETAEGEGEESASEPETIEVEYEGKKYKVSPELKDALLRQGDYTRKSQENAEFRRTVEAERQQVQQMAQLTQEEIGALVDLRGIDAQLNQYAKLDWQALYAQDPFGAGQARIVYDDLKDKRAAALQAYQQASGKRTEQVEQATAKRLQETAQYAQSKIPNWSADLDNQITQFAVREGFTLDTLKSAYTPEVYKMLWKAYVGDQVLQKQAAAKPKPTVQGEKKPSTTVGKSGTTPAGKKSLSDMSMDEYAAEMNRRERERAKRNAR